MYSYIMTNHEDIFKSLSDEVDKKHPDAPNAHRYSYYG